MKYGGFTSWPSLGLHLAPTLGRVLRGTLKDGAWRVNMLNNHGLSHLIVNIHGECVYFLEANCPL